MPSKRSLAKKILVVEDDDGTRDTLKLLLEGEGYVVVTARNGREALDCMRGGTLPAVILLDVLMPVMDGFEFRQLQGQDPSLASIPVIVVAAAGEVGDKADLLGDVGYVQKPLDADVLLAAIRRFTVRHRPVLLVIEDDALVRTMLDMALRHYGFCVMLAASGKEAIELYQQHHQGIALVLLDVQMPDMDGPATLAALKKIEAKLRCCFMSGGSGKYSTEDLLRMGASHVIPKPFASLSLLTRMLWDLVGQ